MAYTKIIPVRSDLNRCLSYTSNPEKTEVIQTKDLERLLSYTQNNEKNEYQLYVAGFNCDPATAFSSMQATKRRWKKSENSGVLGYHIIQSFTPKEVTPEQCFEIGCEFARRFLAERFECTVSTHLNQKHLHCHIVFNSVSFADGRMFRNDFKSYYQGIRKISDELCREFKLSVIETDGHGLSYGDWKRTKQGQPTVRSLVKADADRVLLIATSYEGFLRELENMGYQVNASPNHKYTSVIPPGRTKSIRLEKLSPQYEETTVHRSHIELDGRFAKCMSISHFPQQLNDRFITTLLQQVPYIILSIDVVPVEPEDAMQALEEVRMAVDAEKARFNRRAVDKLDFTASIPPRTLAQEETMKRYYADITEDDQQMMLSMLSVAYFADSLEDLALETDALKTTAVNYNCRFTELFFQQEDAFNTAMPYGLRRLENVHTMVTKNVTALVPFNTQEVLVPGGIYYGVNDMSGNLIVGLRTELMNGNAMILATSGSGKSMFTKQEIMELFLRFPKARFYLVDPENEYRPLVEELGGIVVDISVESRTYLNPLEYKPEPGSDTLPNEAKVEFILSLCEQIMGKNNGYIGDKSIIDNSLRNIYAPYVKANYEGDCPTLHDLWKDLKEQPLERAKEIALALEVYVNGSLSMFAKPTNVDMTNRLICFNIQSLGGQLKAVAMLYMLEFINTRVMTTERSSSACATWVYFDEIYLLLQNELSAQFLFTSWKRFRKYNAFATGITQNIEDCLSNSTAYAMLANSEFVCMLRQTKDIDHVVELYGPSDIQRNYLLKARPGQGILKMANALIPFVNDYPKNTKSYRLLTTKPGELENKSEGDSDE